MIRSFITIIAIGVAIFALAGRLDYWQGWIFFLIYLVLMAAFGVFFAKKQDLMQERLKPGPSSNIIKNHFLPAGIYTTF
jgi:hypothetical protein